MEKRCRYFWSVEPSLSGRKVVVQKAPRPTVVSSRFYLVCLVFHNQSADISDAIARLEDALEGLGLLALGLAALGLKRKVA